MLKWSKKCEGGGFWKGGVNLKCDNYHTFFLLFQLFYFDRLL